MTSVSGNLGRFGLGRKGVRSLADRSSQIAAARQELDAAAVSVPHASVCLQLHNQIVEYMWEPCGLDCGSFLGA